jgi:hypothetical protein
MILEIELWDYWSSLNTVTASGSVDLNAAAREKRELMPVPMKSTITLKKQGELMIKLNFEESSRPTIQG